MSSVAEFIEVRRSIETLTRQITLCVEQHAAQNSRQHLDEANRQLEVLKTMVANDVQVIATGRLSRQLTGLGTKIKTMTAKSPTVKRTAVKKLKMQVRPGNGEEPVIVVYEHP
jgi:cell division protein FtsL